MRRNPRALLLLILLNSIALLSGVSAQEMTPLTLFSRAFARLEPGQSASWQLDALEGSVVSILLEARAADFEPRFVLYDEDGRQLVSRIVRNSQPNAPALLEAFTMPASGRYRIEVSAGQTAGDYSLFILPGYAEQLPLDVMDDGNWSSQAPEQPVFSPERISLLTSRDNPLIHARLHGQEIPHERFYLRAQIQGIDGVDGWQTGITIGESDQNYFFFSINEAGHWRLARSVADETQALRNWQPHPAITPGTRQFSLAFLVNRGALDLFYNEQFVQSVTVENDAQPLFAGLIAGDGSALPRVSRVHFSSIELTHPLSESIEPRNFSFAVRSRARIIRSLQRAALAPAGGELAYQIPEAYWQMVRAGVERFPLAGGAEFQQAALATRLNWEADDDALAGCGIIFANRSLQDYRLAFVDGGGYGLTQKSGDRFINLSFAKDSASAGSVQHLLVVISAERALFYLNGHFAGQMSEAMGAGPMAFAVLNHADGLTRCTFRDTWLWSLPG